MNSASPNPSREEQEELKPCPFCGRRPKHGFMGDDDGGYAFAECIGDSCHFAGFHTDDEAEAIRLWNTRSPTPAPLDRGVDEALAAAAEDYAYNPDTPYGRSGIRGETGIDPEAAFKAGALWHAALRTAAPVGDGLVEPLPEGTAK